MTNLVLLERVHAGYLAGRREVHAVHDVTLAVHDDERVVEKPAPLPVMPGVPNTESVL